MLDQYRDQARLPAVRWKVANLKKLMGNNPEKHAGQRSALTALFR